jgi:hypothetical protein
MSIQYFKKERGGVSPVSPSNDGLVIMKDPPKGIYTRKKERVNVADIMYMVQTDNPRGDPTRINENINYFARGQNPMVEVDYGGHGKGSQNTVIPQGQAGSPYKVEVVRPPMYPVETLVALSRPHIHQNYSATTNPTNFPQINSENFYDKNLVKNMTRTDLISGVLKSTPTVSQLLEFRPLIDQYDTKNKIIADKESGVLYSTPTLQFIGPADEASRNANVEPNKIKDTLLKEMSTNFSTITIYDPKNNSSVDVGSSIRDKNYIAIQAAKGAPITLTNEKGQKVKLKDYTYSVVKPNIGNTQLVIQVKQPDVVLDRNTPLYAASTNSTNPLGFDEGLARENQENFSFLQKMNNRMGSHGEYLDRASTPMNIRADMQVGQKGRIKMASRH